MKYRLRFVFKKLAISSINCQSKNESLIENQII
jgi:hypothetical protein